MNRKILAGTIIALLFTAAYVGIYLSRATISESPDRSETCDFSNRKSTSQTSELLFTIKTTSSVENPEEGASYIIDVSGATYRMKNGTSGQFDYRSTDATQVFNCAYGNLTSGGKIYVSAGLYSLSAAIYPSSNSTTSGEGENTILSMANTTLQPILYINNTQNVRILYLKLTHNFPIIWGSTAKTMDTYDIQALNTTNLEIAYCHITHAADYALSIGCVPSPNFVQLPCYNSFVHNNLFENTASDGLHIRGGFGHVIEDNVFNATGDDELGIAGLPWDPISGVSIKDNIFENGNANAIKFTTENTISPAVVADQISDISIIGNTIVNMTTGAGIWVWVASNNFTKGTIYCSNVTITGNTITNTLWPAFLGEEGKTGCLIRDLTFSGNVLNSCGRSNPSTWCDGMVFYCVIDSRVSGNVLNQCGGSEYYAIDLQNCANCDVSGNTLTNSSGYGIRDASGNANSIHDNQILFSGGYGIVVNLSNDSLIENNYVEASLTLTVQSSSNDTIYHNDFMGQVVVDNSPNVWDDGYPSGGNYYSLYHGSDVCSGPYQNETGSDDIGDTPNLIGPNNTDNYPLMYPFYKYNIALMNVTAKNIVDQGMALPMEVTVKNKGALETTFNLTLNVTYTYLPQELVFTLLADSIQGWNQTVPGPTIECMQGDTIDLTLMAADTSRHLFFVDYNGNRSPDSSEPQSLPFINQNETLTFTADTAGNFAYYDAYNQNTMFGQITVNPTPYFNEQVGFQNATLQSKDKLIVNFGWNTTGFVCGNYTLIAYAVPVPGETDTTDNTYSSGVTTVTIPGDIDGDFKVSLTDLAILANAYGSRPDDAKWNPNADINGNGVVGLSDLVILAIHYGQHYP